MIDDLFKAYIDVLFEDNFSDENWIKYKSYKGIDFYIRLDRHLQQRLNERYDRLRLTDVILVMKKFIKDEINGRLKFRTSFKNDEFPYTIFAKITKMYVSGRFKANNGVWRCYIATVLPNKDAHYNSNDYYKEINA